MRILGEVNFQHEDLAAGGWKRLSFAEQMGNIGSEVSRSLKWQKKNEKIFRGAFERALELYDLSISAAQEEKADGRLTELCRAREEFCDYFYGGNSFHTDASKMLNYYNQFALMR